jgi:hypothetical protein
MTWRQITWFLGVYVGIVAMAVWLNVSVFCLADAKYSGGCGGLGVYFFLWLIFLAPLVLAAIALESWRRTTTPPSSRLLLYLAAIAGVLELGWLVIERFPMLLATEVVVIALWWFARLKTTAKPSDDHRVA